MTAAPPWSSRPWYSVDSKASVFDMFFVSSAEDKTEMCNFFENGTSLAWRQCKGDCFGVLSPPKEPHIKGICQPYQG